MDLLNELMEAKKKPQSRLPYDQYVIERDRIESEFSKIFRAASAVHIDRVTLEVESGDNVSRKSNLTFEKIPVRIGKVFGSFDVSHMGLTSLENGPRVVGKNLYAGGNKLTSLRGGPRYVGGDYKVEDNELTTLEGAPEEIHGDFDASGNPLVSIKGIPNMIVNWLALPFNPSSPYGILKLPMIKVHGVHFSPDKDDYSKDAAALTSIVSKHINQGRKGVVELQRQLLDASLDKWARLE